MPNDEPDAAAIADMVDGLERARLAAARGPHPRLTLVGEMAAILCHAGKFEAALQLEQLWNDLTRELPILTVCAYPIECFDQTAAPERSQRFCAQHSAISDGAERRTQPLPC
jgi:hypothetical protein